MMNNNNQPRLYNQNNVNNRRRLYPQDRPRTNNPELNNNIQNGENIALLIQYGHASKTGAWVEGRDYINPAIQPLFDQIVEEAIEEIKKS